MRKVIKNTLMAIGIGLIMLSFSAVTMDNILLGILVLTGMAVGGLVLITIANWL